MARGAGGSTGKYKDDLIRPKTVVVDPEFFLKRATKEMDAANTSKFKQNPELTKALIETKTAKQVSHQQRIASGKKVKTADVDKEKERLNMLASHPVFQENALDNLFLHISNTVASKQSRK